MKKAAAAALAAMWMAMAGAIAAEPPSAQRPCVSLWKEVERGQASPDQLWAACAGQRDESGAGLRLRAAREGRWEWLKSWGAASAEARRDRDGAGNTILHAAALAREPGSVWLAREWAKSGASLDVKNKAGVTPLRAALGAGGPGPDELARELLRLGADPSAAGPNGETALHYIASARGPEQAEWLGKKADVKRRSADGLTPLEVAIAQDNGAMTRWLLEKGAPREDAKAGPLVYLAAGKPKALEAFLGAAPEQAKRRGKGGQTLLHAAVMAESPPSPFSAPGEAGKKEARPEASSVSLLLAHGLDPNARDERGITPVMLAVAQGKASSLERLLRAGADLCAVDNQGFPAWRMANSLSAPELLRKMGRCR